MTSVSVEFWYNLVAYVLIKIFDSINPFISNPPFLHPLETSEHRKVFWCFQGIEKGCIGNEWVNHFHWYMS